MKKFLVIAHVYYHEMWSLLDSCIQNLPKDSFDLIQVNYDFPQGYLINYVPSVICIFVLELFLGHEL